MMSHVLLFLSLNIKTENICLVCLCLFLGSVDDRSSSYVDPKSRGRIPVVNQVHKGSHDPADLQSLFVVSRAPILSRPGLSHCSSRRAPQHGKGLWGAQPPTPEDPNKIQTCSRSLRIIETPDGWKWSEMYLWKLSKCEPSVPVKILFVLIFMFFMKLF